MRENRMIQEFFAVVGYKPALIGRHGSLLYFPPCFGKVIFSWMKFNDSYKMRSTATALFKFDSS